MRAVVMDIRDDEAVVLDQEGVFRIVENHDYEIGQNIEVVESLVDHDIISFPKTKSAGLRKVAAAGLVLLVLGGIASLAIPSARIQAKGNASLTYRMNIWDRVINVDGNNRQGKEIADRIHVGFPGRPVDAVMQESFDIMEEENGEGKLGGIEFSAHSTFGLQGKRTDDRLMQYQQDWENRKDIHDKQLSDPDEDNSGKKPSGSVEEKPGKEPSESVEEKPGKEPSDSDKEKPGKAPSDSDKEKPGKAPSDSDMDDKGKNQPDSGKEKPRKGSSDFGRDDNEGTQQDSGKEKPGKAPSDSGRDDNEGNQPDSGKEEKPRIKPSDSDKKGSGSKSGHDEVGRPQEGSEARERPGDEPGK